MDIYLLSQLLNGVIFGLLYALIALGLTIVFSIMRVVNFAHGELYMLGGYVLYFFTIPLGWPPLVGLVLCMIVVALVGFVIERALLRPVYTGYVSFYTLVFTELSCIVKWQSNIREHFHASTS